MTAVEDRRIGHHHFRFHESAQDREIETVFAGAESRLIVFAENVDDTVTIHLPDQRRGGIGLAVIEPSNPFPVRRGLEVGIINDDPVSPVAEDFSKQALSASSLVDDFLLAIPGTLGRVLLALFGCPRTPTRG